MKLIKNIFKFSALLAVLFLVAAIAIPIFYKDKIVDVLKDETNKSLNAKVDFRDAELSLLRNFPAITLTLDNLTVDGVNEFAGTRLLTAPGIELELDFWQVWNNRESIPVKAFTVESPQVNVRVLKNGQANWDISKAGPTPVNAEPVAYMVQMEHYSIMNGSVTYIDESLDFEMEMDNLNHNGSGDFSESVFDLDTATKIGALSVELEGMTYLRKAKADLDAIINMNVNDLVFTLKDNVLNLNALTIKTDGMVVQYPDLPLALQSIFADLTINSPSSDFDDLVVRIPQFEFKLGDNPFGGNFNLRNPVSDPKLKTEVRGIIDLADVAKAIPLEGVTNLQGVINSDFYVNAAMSQIENEQYEALDIRGNIEVMDILVEQTDLPKVVINSLMTDFSPQSIKFDNFNALLGQSDMRASGQIRNLLAYFSPDKTMEGNFKIKSDYFNANEWVTEEMEATPKVGFYNTQKAIDQAPKTVLTADETSTEVFDRFNFNIDADIKKLDYDTYKMTDFTFDGIEPFWLCT